MFASQQIGTKRSEVVANTLRTHLQYLVACTGDAHMTEREYAGHWGRLGVWVREHVDAGMRICGYADVRAPERAGFREELY